MTWIPFEAMVKATKGTKNLGKVKLPAIKANHCFADADGRPLPTKEDLWNIRGQWYDLRAFVERHPGGVDAIVLGQGLDDCTTLFESYHPFTTKPAQILGKYVYTGEIAPSEPKDADSRYMAEIKGKALEEHAEVYAAADRRAGRVLGLPAKGKQAAGNVTGPLDPFFDWKATPFYDDCKSVARAHFSVGRVKSDSDSDREQARERETQP